MSATANHRFRQSQLIFNSCREDPLQPSLRTSQVDRLATVDGDEARLGALRLADICDRDRVNIRAARILEFRKVNGELAGVQDRLGKKTAIKMAESKPETLPLSPERAGDFSFLMHSSYFFVKSVI